jgi:hypothetical protein
MVKVKIINSCEHTGVKAGEVYEAKRYHLDPGKYILERRIPDGHDPMCTEYAYNVALWMGPPGHKKWMQIVDNTYVELEE